jgi:Phage portal protein, SPP1 Gp6-like
VSQTFLSQSVPGPSALSTFTRSVDPQQLQTYLSLEQAEVLRLKRYNEFWRFYLGHHWEFAREGGEPLVTVNYSRRIADKIADWMCNEGIVMKTAPSLQNTVLPILEEVWKYNNLQEWLRTYVLTGGVTGDVFALVTYEQPTEQARRVNPHTQGRIKVQILGSEQVFPTWDPLNKSTLLQVRIETLYHDTMANNQGQQGNAQRNLHVLRFTQTITPTKIIEQFQGGEPVVRDNVLGEIALIHVSNQIVPGEYYGLSDLDGVVALNREFNEKMTDQSDIVNYHAAPTTVITGAKAGQLERGAKQIWSGLPEGATVKLLELAGGLGVGTEYAAAIKEAMLEIGCIPTASLGKDIAISNTSAVALKIQFQPLVELIKRKRPQYERGIAELNYFILRITEIVDPTFRLPMDLCASCGGRIVELTMPDGTSRRKCYMVDEGTFDFMKVADVPIKYLRQHSFGPSVEEAPFRQVVEEYNKLAPSAWDPAETVDLQAEYEEKQAAAPAPPVSQPQEAPTGEEEGEGEEEDETPPAPVPPVAPGPKRPEPPTPQFSNIELPAEPELIVVMAAVPSPLTGELVAGRPQVVQVVPTGCKKPRYLNPYDTTVTFKDTLPRDIDAETERHERMIKNNIVSRDWVREHMPEVEDPRAEKARVDDQMRQDAVMRASAGGHAEQQDTATTGGERRVGRPSLPDVDG